MWLSRNSTSEKVAIFTPVFSCLSYNYERFVKLIEEFCLDCCSLSEDCQQERVKRWLLHFGLIKKEEEWNHIHVSGHGSADQIKRIIEGCNSKSLIPVHTEHEEYHKKWHPHVKHVQLNDTISL